MQSDNLAKENMQTHNFFDDNDSVPAHRHINPDGTQGGWVANSAYVAPTVYLHPDATVYNTARVLDYVGVTSTGWIHDDAEVSGYSVISGEIAGCAKIFGPAQVPFGAVIQGHAYVDSTDDIITLNLVRRLITVFPDKNRVWYIVDGCQCHSIEYWEANLDEIAKAHDIGYYIPVARATIDYIKELITFIEIANKASTE